MYPSGDKKTGFFVCRFLVREREGKKNKKKKKKGKGESIGKVSEPPFS
jgi:hypothetical protein